VTTNIKEEEQGTLVSIIVYGPIVSLFFWSTLRHIGFKMQETVYYLVSYFVLFVFLPDFVISPYNDWEWFSSFDADNLLQTLSFFKMFIFLSILMTYFIFQLQSYPKNPLIDDVDENSG